jgi:hypothetical protein
VPCLPPILTFPRKGQWHEVKGGSGAPAEGGVSRRNDEEKKTNRSFTG